MNYTMLGIFFVFLSGPIFLPFFTTQNYELRKEAALLGVFCLIMGLCLPDCAYQWRKTLSEFTVAIEEEKNRQEMEIKEAFSKGYDVYINNVKQDREELLLTTDILNSHSLVEVNKSEEYIGFETKEKDRIIFFPLFLPMESTLGN